MVELRKYREHPTFKRIQKDHQNQSLFSVPGQFSGVCLRCGCNGAGQKIEGDGF